MKQQSLYQDRNILLSNGKVTRINNEGFGIFKGYCNYFDGTRAIVEWIDAISGYCGNRNIVTAVIPSTLKKINE